VEGKLGPEGHILSQVVDHLLKVVHRQQGGLTGSDDAHRHLRTAQHSTPQRSIQL
jgi:hypothetical protein